MQSFWSVDLISMKIVGFPIAVFETSPRHPRLMLFYVHVSNFIYM